MEVISQELGVSQILSEPQWMLRQWGEESGQGGVGGNHRLICKKTLCLSFISISCSMEQLHDFRFAVGILHAKLKMKATSAK